MNEQNLNRFKYIKSNNEFITDQIIDDDFHHSNKKYIIINVLSKKHNNILLPKFIQSKHKELKRLNINYMSGVNNAKLLKYVIDNHIETDIALFFGLIALSPDAKSFINEYLFNLSQKKKIDCYVIDYNPDYKGNLDVYDNVLASTP